MVVIQVPGENVGNVKLYALSTCGWCQKTKKLLENMGVAYEYEDVDILYGDEREKAVQEIKKWNPSGGFPTIVVGNEKCIVGYKEGEIREALGK
jgi:glutaredoxin